MGALNRFLLAAAQRKDIVFAVFFVLVVGMLIIPLPTFLVDTLLAINLTLTLIILITATYLKTTLDISTFPAIILVTTVFRVALSVSTTRLILAFGDAGHLILGFGNFVIAGNVVVGIVVFLVIAIVQFMVITKGAERISEVSARFTLDAMPGKQMSIDNDLRSGDITKEDARRKRSNLEQESAFHGAMDGAMRFVKGDAIASLIIVVVNLLGGLIIGMVQRGLSFGEAGHLYTLLSIGDGLVAQIPAMFIAIAAGTVVTRVDSEESKDLGSDIFRQLSGEPKAIGISGAVAFCLGLIPGFPTAVFFILGALLCTAAYFMSRAPKTSPEQPRVEGGSEREGGAEPPSEPTDEGSQASDESAPPAQSEEQKVPLRSAEPGDVLVLRGMPAFLKLWESVRVFSPVIRAREAFTRRYGFPSPSMGFQVDSRVKFGDIIADIDDVPSARLTLEDAEPGVPLTEDHITKIAQFISVQWRRNASIMFGTTEATTWFGSLEGALGRLVTDVQQIMPFMGLVDVLRKLLEEGVGLTPPRLVLEGILSSAQRSQDPDMIADLTRGYLRRQICNANAHEGRRIDAILVSPEFDPVFQALRSGERPDEELAGLFLTQFNATFGPFASRERLPVLLASGESRRAVRRLLMDQGHDIVVLGFNEVAREFEIKNLGILSTQSAQAA